MQAHDRLLGKHVGNFRIISLVNSGSFANVYTAKHLLLHERPIYAIKILHANLMYQREQERFIQEANLLDRLNHPHILPIAEAGIYHDDNRPYIVTDFAANGNLRARMMQRVPLVRALSFISQIGNALHYAHKLYVKDALHQNQSIVHRDLKPENILFDKSDRILLADFGISIELDGGRTAREQPIEGTYEYMAPEQFDGEVSVRSDLYSLGSIAYELLAGERPIQVNLGPYANGEARRVAWENAQKHQVPRVLRQINPSVPEHVEEAILKALSKERDYRQDNVRDFLVELGLASSRHTTANLPISDLLKGAKRFREAGDAENAEGNYERALELYDQSLFLDDENADTYIRKGNVLRAVKSYGLAIEAYRNASQFTATKKDICHFSVGHVFSDLKMYDAAEAAYDEAIKLSPKKEVFYLFKADALFHFKNFIDASAVYDEAIYYANEHSNKVVGKKAYLGQALVLFELRLYPVCFKAYEDAIKLDPKDPQLYLAKASAHEKLAQYDMARQTYETGLQINPLHSDLQQKLEALRRSRGI